MEIWSSRCSASIVLFWLRRGHAYLLQWGAEGWRDGNRAEGADQWGEAASVMGRVTDLWQSQCLLGSRGEA